MSTWFSRLFSNEEKLKRKRLEDKLARKKMVKYVKRKLRLPGNVSSSSSSLSSNASLATTNRKLRNTVRKLNLFGVKTPRKSHRHKSHRHRSHRHKSHHKSHRHKSHRHKSHRKSRAERAEARQSKANYHQSMANHHQSRAKRHRARYSSSSRSSSRSSISQDYTILANLNPEEAGALEKAIQILQNIKNKSAGVEVGAPPPSAAVVTAVVADAVQRASAAKEPPPAASVAALHAAADTAKPLEDATVKAMQIVEDLKVLNESQAQIVRDMMARGVDEGVVQQTIAEAKRSVELKTAEAQALLQVAEKAQEKAEGAAEKLDAVLHKNAPNGTLSKAATGIGGYVKENAGTILKITAALAVVGGASFYFGGPVLAAKATLGAIKTGYEYGKGYAGDAAQYVRDAPSKLAEGARGLADAIDPTQPTWGQTIGRGALGVGRSALGAVDPRTYYNWYYGTGAKTGGRTRRRKNIH